MTRTLKRETELGFTELHALIRAHFSGTELQNGKISQLIITIKDFDIEKNMEELATKGYITIDEDLSIYEY